MGYSKRNSKCWYLFKALLGKKSGKKAVTHKWYQEDQLKIDVQILQNWKLLHNYLKNKFSRITGKNTMVVQMNAGYDL